MAVHQQRFDRGAALSRDAIKPLAVECRRQRLNTQHRDQRVLFNATPFMPQHGPETARIAQAQRCVGEDQIDVIVLLRRRSVRHQAQAAGHAQVKDQPAAITFAGAIEKQVFSAPMDGADRQASEAAGQFRRNVVAQSRHAKNGLDDPFSGQVGEQPKTADFDFGEFRHLLRVTKVHNMGNPLWLN